MSKTQIGTKLFVATALPATNDAAGFAALTWIEVQGRQQLFRLGVTHSDIEIELLEGFNDAVKGAGAGLTSTGMFADRFSGSTRDPGQAALIAAAESADGTLSVKQVKGSGANNDVVIGDIITYAQGYAKDYQPMQPTVSSYAGFEVGFRQRLATVRAAQA